MKHIMREAMASKSAGRKPEVLNEVTPVKILKQINNFSLYLWGRWVFYSQ